MIESTISALCYSIIQTLPGADDGLEFPNNDVARYVIMQHRRMPDYLRIGIGIFTCTFDLWGILTGLRLFHNQSIEARARQIEYWKKAPLGPMRDLMRVYESLAVICWYSKQDHLFIK